MGYMDMLGKFFKKSEATISRKDENRSGIYRFRGHAERDFWRWVCSWSRAIRRPSDLGFDDNSLTLPQLITRQHVVSAESPADGFLFSLPACGLSEQRKERSRTVEERCEKAAECVAANGSSSVQWCYLNSESSLLAKMTRGAVEVSGSDTDEEKEEKFAAFESGEIKVLVTKPTIAGFGLNWQHCSHQTFFPSHSFEQWYQAIRRSWRFGQKNPVTVDIITSEGERDVMLNLQRKSDAAEKMFSSLVSLMGQELEVRKHKAQTPQTELPSWI
jgi:hypothetical protein